MPEKNFDTPKSRIRYVFLFLIGLPLCGAVFGYLFYSVLDFVSGPYGPLAPRFSIVFWAFVGLVQGIYAFWTFTRYDKALDKAMSSKHGQT